MFQFARQSAKAVLVAASAAGIAALGAGAAGADDLGALSATDSLPQSNPVQTLPAGLGGGAGSLVSHVKDADLRHAQPAPGTVNLGTPAGDMSQVGPQTQAQLDTVHNVLDRARHTAGLGGVVPQAAPVEGVGSSLPTGALPVGSVTDLLGGASSTLPLNNGVVPQAGPAVTGGALPVGTVHSLLGGASSTLPLNNGVVPQAAPVDGVATTLPASAMPLGPVHELLGGATQTLPLSNGVVPQAAPVDGVATTLPASDVVPSQGGPAGMLPVGGATDLLGGNLLGGLPGGGAQTLPLSNELPAASSVEGKPAELAGEAVGTAVERSAGEVLPNTTDEVDRLAEELPEPSTGSVTDQLPETPVSVDGLDSEAVESSVPGSEQVQEGVGTVQEETPELGEVSEQVDTSEAVGDVAEAAAGGAGATGVADVAKGVSTPVL